VSNTIKLFNLGHFSISNFLSWRNEVVHDGNHNSLQNPKAQLVITSWLANSLIKQKHWWKIFAFSQV
jgi:hypothetical protein